MTTALEEFRSLLERRLIRDFCGREERGMNPTGFRQPQTKLHELDAENFLRTWRAGIFEHVGGGIYRIPQSGAREQLFWSGRVQSDARSFSLWLEPVICMATISVLHFDLGWPLDQIGGQSVDNAFDLVTYRGASRSEAIAGEIKKTAKELDQLIEWMTLFAARPDVSLRDAEFSPRERNALKKVEGLRTRHAPYFWAIGPGGYRRPFQVQYGQKGEIDLIETEECSLRFDQE